MAKWANDYTPPGFQFKIYPTFATNITISTVNWVTTVT